ncbi:MAG: hypothetical protein ACP5E5_02485 [Acidobacteriaceae bacterium]
MRSTLSIAAALLVLPLMPIRAQITSPDKLIAPPPRNPAEPQRMRPTAPSSGALQWLWQYTRPAPIGEAANLRVDERFQAFLQSAFHQPQTMWGPPGAQEPLATIIPLFLTQYGEVRGEENRYITVDGCVPNFCAASGLLWIDLGQAHPLAVFAAVNWNPSAHSTDEPQANYNLWLFSSRTLSPDAVPYALTEAIAHWNFRLAAAHRLVPHIEHALLVEPSGNQFPLHPELIGANVIAPQPETATPQRNPNPDPTDTN